MQKNTPFISLVVSTYNWPQALRLVCLSLFEQTYKDFEIIFADDGSTQSTAEIVRWAKQESPVPVFHVWQPDTGFRAAKIRNTACKQSTGRYLVFLDGDCMVFPDFLCQHKALAQKKRFVIGNRVLLSKSFTDQILSEQLLLFTWSFWQFLYARISGKINRILPLMKFPYAPFRNLVQKKWKGAMSCNMGVWKDDFYTVNGFDETFEGWGHEDADLVVRLFNNNIYRKDGRFSVPVLHMWHHNAPRTKEKENLHRLGTHMKSKKRRASCGVTD